MHARSPDGAGGIRQGCRHRQPVGGGPRARAVADHGDQAHRRARGPARRKTPSPHARAGCRSPTPAAITSRPPSASSPTSSAAMPPSPPSASSRAAIAAAQRAGELRRRGRSRLCSAAFARRHPLVSVELGLNDRLVDLAEEGWDLADPHRQSQQFQPDRAAHRALPHRRLRGAVLSQGARHAAHGGRASRSTIVSATRCRKLTGVDRWTFGASEMSAFTYLGQSARQQWRCVAGRRDRGAGHHLPADLHRRRRICAGHDWSRSRSISRPCEFGGIYAVYLPDRNPAAKVRAFIDFIAGRFAPEPPWERGLN